MSIIEVETQDEVHGIEGDYFYSDQGVLWVKGNNRTVAMFAPGEWSSAIRREPVNIEEVVDAELVPRVWQSSAHIPEGVIAIDTDGDYWKVESGRRYLRGLRGNWGTSQPDADLKSDDDSFGPFTEVLGV